MKRFAVIVALVSVACGNKDSAAPRKESPVEPPPAPVTAPKVALTPAPPIPAAPPPPPAPVDAAVDASVDASLANARDSERDVARLNEQAAAFADLVSDKAPRGSQGDLGKRRPQTDLQAPDPFRVSAKSDVVEPTESYLETHLSMTGISACWPTGRTAPLVVSLSLTPGGRAFDVTATGADAATTKCFSDLALAADFLPTSDGKHGAPTAHVTLKIEPNR